MSEKPNILFLCVDALRVFECIHKDYDAKVDSYNRLAKHGIEFWNMIATSTTTSPCMASIHTGEYPFNHNTTTLRGPKIRESIPLFTEILAENGYDTRALVQSPMTAKLGFARGYNEFDEYWYSEEIDSREDWYDRIVGKFEEVNSPWFYFVHFPEVHLPRRVNEEFDQARYGRTRYERAVSAVDNLIGRIIENIDLSETVVIYTSDHGESVASRWMETAFNFAQPLEFLTKKRYELGLDPTLDWIERRLNVLRKLGLQTHDRFTTVDHGFYPYECLVRIPFVMAGGNIEPDVRIDKQVRQIDIAPTILHLAGLEDEIDVTGESIMPVSELEEREYAYLMANGPMHWDTTPFEGVRTPKWKYVESGDTSALYDHQSDPVELRNIKSQHPEVTERLASKLIEIKGSGDLSGKTDVTGDEMDELMNSLEELGYI